MFRFYVAVFCCLAMLIAPTVQANDLVLHFDLNTGNLSLDASAVPLSTVQIQTASPVFTGARPSNLNNFFDVFDPFKIFKLDPAGFSELDFGAVIEPGTTPQHLADQFCVSGSPVIGGALTSASLMAEQREFPLQISGTCPSPPTIASRPFAFEYDAATGTLEASVEGAVNDPAYTIMALRSNRDQFIGTKPATAAGFSGRAIVAISPNGISDFRFGEVLEPNLDGAELAQSLCLTAKSIDASSPRLSAHTLNGHPLSVCGAIEDADQQFGKSEVSLRYDSSTGSLEVDSPDVPIHLMFVQTATPMIIPDNADPTVFADPFDLINDSLIRFSEQFGVNGASFGNVLPAGLTQEQLRDQVTVTGRFVGGAFIEPVWVPEPTSHGGMASTLCFLALGSVSLRRRR